MRIRRRTLGATFAASCLALMAALPGCSPCPEDSGNAGGPVADLRMTWLLDGPMYCTHPLYYPEQTIAAMTLHVPQIAQLGVKTVYVVAGVMKHIPPPAGSSTPNYFMSFMVEDWYAVDPGWGTDADFRAFVATVHAHGMRVIVEMPNAYTEEGCPLYPYTYRIPLPELQNRASALGYGTLAFESNKKVYAFGKWYLTVDRAVYDQRTSGSKVFGRIIGDEVVLYHSPWPKFGPAVDRAHPGALAHFAQVAAHWVREYDIDGWRLDLCGNNHNPDIISGEHSSHALIQRMKKAVTAVKPDAVVYTENVGPAGYQNLAEPPVFDEVSDASYGAYFSHAFNSGCLGTSAKLVDWLRDIEKVWHGRTRTRCSESVENFHRAARDWPRQNRGRLTIISTIPGIPYVQAGQEIGAKNHPVFDPPAVDWDNGDTALRDFTRKVFEIRAARPALKYGSIEDLWKGGDTLYAYSRTYGNERAIVAVNLRDRTAQATLDLSFLDAGAVLTDEFTGERFVVGEPAAFEISVPPYGSRILTLALATP